MTAFFLNIVFLNKWCETCFIAIAETLKYFQNDVINLAKHLQRIQTWTENERSIDAADIK